MASRIPPVFHRASVGVINDPMGKEPSARFSFIMEHAQEAADIDV